MPKPRSLDAKCTMCFKVITFGTTHCKVSLRMMDGKVSVQRYCPACCDKPETSVNLFDVKEYPVRDILIQKVWA